MGGRGGGSYFCLSVVSMMLFVLRLKLNLEKWEAGSYKCKKEKKSSILMSLSKLVWEKLLSQVCVSGKN